VGLGALFQVVLALVSGGHEQPTSLPALTPREKAALVVVSGLPAPKGVARVFVGRSSRTNEAAVVDIRKVLEPYGYTVCDTVVRGCLHLKSAVTALADDLLLVNRDWIDEEVFDGFSLLDVEPEEAAAANALRLEDRLIVAAAFPRTAERLMQHGFRLEIVDVSELAKAEGAVTCCSLIVKS